MACGSGRDQEYRELRALEGAMALVANAQPEDRGIRLAQLKKVEVESERIGELKQKCLSAYQAFQRASGSLARARVETERVADRVAELKVDRAAGATLSVEEEVELRTAQLKAMETVQKVTRELDLAEGYVAGCEKRLRTLKEELGTK